MPQQPAIITNATIRFYSDHEANINLNHLFLVPHTGQGEYRLDDIDGGKYTFAVSAADRGTVVGYITLPSETDPQALVKQIPNIEMVAGRAVIDVNIVNNVDAPVTDAIGRLLISRIDGTVVDPAIASWVVNNVPVGSRLIEFKPTGAAQANYQNYKVLRNIDASTGTIDLTIFPPFSIKVDCWKGTTSSSILDNTNTRVWVQKPLETKWTELFRSGGSTGSFFNNLSIDGLYKIRGLESGKDVGYEKTVALAFSNAATVNGVNSQRIDLFSQQGQSSFPASEMI